MLNSTTTTTTSTTSKEDRPISAQNERTTNKSKCIKLFHTSGVPLYLFDESSGESKFDPLTCQQLVLTERKFKKAAGGDPYYAMDADSLWLLGDGAMLVAAMADESQHATSKKSRKQEMSNADDKSSSYSDSSSSSSSEGEQEEVSMEQEKPSLPRRRRGKIGSSQYVGVRGLGKIGCQG